jgi:hypothetical protein
MHLVSRCHIIFATLPGVTYYEPYNVPSQEIALRQVSATRLLITNHSVVTTEQFLWGV